MDGTNFRRILLRASTSQYIPCSKQGRKDTPVKNDAPIDEKEQEQETPKSLLEELIREGARRLLQAAIEQEVTEYLERFRRVSQASPVGVEINVRNESTKGSHFDPKGAPSIVMAPLFRPSTYSGSRAKSRDLRLIPS